MAQRKGEPPAGGGAGAPATAYCEPDRREMGDIAVALKKRTVAPCPCPEDELVQPYELNRRRAADFRRVAVGLHDDLDRLYGPPLDDRDQRGYCRMMAKLHGLDVSAGYKTPTHQRLRNRLVIEQTWFDLQAKMFLPPPVTNDRPITVVLGALDRKRNFSAAKERALWKLDMTATVGRGAGPAYSCLWGHAPRARLCACPDTPCRCTRTRAMPRVFKMPKGHGMKHVPRPSTAVPYVVDRLKRNVELDRRFYIKVAERGLMDCIRPEVCLDECVPYFKVDQRKEAQAYDERCLDLTRRLRDTCLDDECDVCDEMIEEESSSSSSDDADLNDFDEDVTGPCRANCSAIGANKPAAAAAAAGADKAEPQTKGATVLARIRTYFKVPAKAPPPRRNLLGGPKESTGVNAASLDSMGSLRSAGSDDGGDGDGDAMSDSDEESEDVASPSPQRGPWPTPPLTALYTLTATPPPPPPPPRVPFVAALPAVVAPIVAQVEKQDSYPSQPARVQQPPNQLLIRDECPEKTDLLRWYMRVALLWIFDIKDTHRTRGIQVTERDIATAYDPSLVFDDEDVIDPKRLKKMQKKIKKTNQRKSKNKATAPMIDEDRKRQEKDAIEQKKREAKEIKMKEKVRERKRLEKAKQRARAKRIKPKVFCECKAREFKIIEARKQSIEPWGSWCPPDPAPEQEIVYEQLVLSPEDLPPAPPPVPPDTRDLMVQIDLPPIEPGTALSEEMYTKEELEMMGSVEFPKKAGKGATSAGRVTIGERRSAPDNLVVANSIEETLHSSIPKVPRPQPRSLYDTKPKPKPKPRVREIVMQTDSDPGPLREQNVQYEKQCVCRPGPNSKCTCKAEGEQGPCSCKTPSPLDGGPPCICKPRFGTRTKRRKKCKSRKCKKCREKVLSGRDHMAKTRTKDEKIKEEKEKIRIEKAKLKAMKNIQRNEGRRDKGELRREKEEMKAAAIRLREEMREREEKLKEQKRREQDRERRRKAQVKEQRRQAARDEAFRRRLSEMRRPEAEFCGCKDWQKGLCRIKIPPDIEEARKALLESQEAAATGHTNEPTKPTTSDTGAMFVGSVDCSDSEFMLRTHRQPNESLLRKHKYCMNNYVTNVSISREMRDSYVDVTNHISLSENCIRDVRSLNSKISQSRLRESRSWNDDIRLNQSSSIPKKISPAQRFINKNVTPNMSYHIDSNRNHVTNYDKVQQSCQQNTCRFKDGHVKDIFAAEIAGPSNSLSGKQNQHKPIKKQPQSNRLHQIPKHEILKTVDNNASTTKVNEKTDRARHRPICANIAETVFTRSDEDAINKFNQKQIIGTEKNGLSVSKSGLNKFVDKMLNKRAKDVSRDCVFRNKIEQKCKRAKEKKETRHPKTDLDKNGVDPNDKLPEGSMKKMNSRFLKRKFGKSIVTSLISIFNNSSCRMPKGYPSILIPAQPVDPSIAEEASDAPAAPPLGAETSVAQRPGRHLLGSPPPPPTRRNARR